MAEELNFNYTDTLQGNAYTQFIADQHDKAVQTTGRKTYVFKLDKIETKLSEVYKEETNGRVYLPHFEQRGIYKSNTFVSQLSVKNFTETEEALEIEYDFGRMIHIITELKQKTAGKLKIKNISLEPLEIEITNDKVIIKNFRQTLFEEKIDNKIYKIIDKLKKQNLIEINYDGINEMASFVDKVFLKLKPRREQEINLNNSIYKNVSDVITHGDIIVSDRGRVYQVVGAYPRNDIYGRYINWNVQCELINLAKLDGMPSDFVEFIKNNQYGFNNKYNLG